MKNRYRIVILFLALGLFASPAAHSQQSLIEVHREGMALFNEGNYQEALLKFQQVLRAQPSYINARVYANKCKLALTQNQGPKRTMEDALDKVIIPTVNFEEVPLGDALAYIRQRTTELTAGKITPNIIFSGSSDQRQGSLVTMKLNQVPVTTLLKYIGTQTRSKIQYDQYAIMVTPFENTPQTAVVVPDEAPNPFQ